MYLGFLRRFCYTYNTVFHVVTSVVEVTLRLRDAFEGMDDLLCDSLFGWIQGIC